jgi:hypothetical protein
MMTHYRLEKVKVGDRYALLDVIVDGYLNPVELSEIVTAAIGKSKGERNKFLRGHGVVDLQVHFIPAENQDD